MFASAWTVTKSQIECSLPCDCFKHENKEGNKKLGQGLIQNCERFEFHWLFREMKFNSKCITTKF